MTISFNRTEIGDCRAVLAGLPARTFNCCVTSPPYWGLRDYQVDGQIGLEETPGEYVARLVEVFRLVRHVLRDDATLWLNLGDSYIGPPGGGQGPGGQRASRSQPPKVSLTKRAEGLKNKDLAGMPWRVAFALQADGWWLRSEIIWAKATPMPESVEDRPTKAHEQVFLFAKSPRYYYDQKSIREPVSGGAHSRGNGVNPKALANAAGSKQNPSFSAAVSGLVEDRNARDVWTIPGEPYSGAHFACMPRELARRCILAGCPEGGVVLDPFHGSGTVGQVAEAHGRRWFGIELNPAYAPLIAKRTAQVGMMFAGGEP